MKNIAVNIEIKKYLATASIVYCTNSAYNVLANFNQKYANIEELGSLIQQIKAFSKKYINLRRSKVSFNLILDPNLVQIDILTNHFEQKVDNLINKTHINNYKKYIAKSSTNKNYDLINDSVFIYEVVDNDQRKKYSSFPIDKNGSKLIMHYALWVIKKDNKMYAKLMDLFKHNGIELSNIFSPQSCLLASQEVKNHSILIDFDWKTLSIDNCFNTTLLISTQSKLNFTKLFKVCGNIAKVSDILIIPYVKSILNNWEHYVNETKNESNEQQIFNILYKCFTDTLKTVEENYDKNYPEGQKVEFIIKGDNSRLFQYLLAKEFGIKCQLYDDYKAQISALENTHLGAAILTFDKSKIDLVQTLTNLEEIKPKNFIQKIFASLKNHRV